VGEQTTKVIDTEDDYIEHVEEVKLKTKRVAFVMAVASFVVIAIIYGIFIPIVRAGVTGLPS
jgi:hypothetical protein